MERSIERHIYGWLLLTPAVILLIAFTHYPTVATVIDSLFSKGSAIRPSRFVGLGNYEMMIEDPIFWKVLANNAWFALGTIPTSIILAIIMALFVNRAHSGPRIGPDGLLYAHDPADDCRRQHLALFLHP